MWLNIILSLDRFSVVFFFPEISPVMVKLVPFINFSSSNLVASLRNQLACQTPELFVFWRLETEPVIIHLLGIRPIWSKYPSGDQQKRCLAGHEVHLSGGFMETNRGVRQGKLSYGIYRHALQTWLRMWNTEEGSILRTTVPPFSCLQRWWFNTKSNIVSVIWGCCLWYRVPYPQKYPCTTLSSALQGLFKQLRNFAIHSWEN